VGWIWLGCLILISGSVICMWPQYEPEESRVWSFARGASAAAASITVGIVLALMPVQAFAQTSSAHAGVVQMENATEREIFTKLRCMCGGCQRLPLSGCICPDAAAAREEIRRKLAAGEDKDAIVLAYVRDYGSDAGTVPPNTGGMRAIYAVPLVAILGGGVALAFMLKRWRTKDTDVPGRDAPRPLPGETPPGKTAGPDEYDARLDEELKDLDG
jgi:cytochrome c-type biogenesis protein CcmF